MKVSYQDIAVRLEVVEEQVGLILRTISLTSSVTGETRSLLDIYRQLKWEGARIINAANTAPDYQDPLAEDDDQIDRPLAGADVETSYQTETMAEEGAGQETGEGNRCR